MPAHGQGSLQSSSLDQEKVAPHGLGRIILAMESWTSMPIGNHRPRHLHRLHRTLPGGARILLVQMICLLT